MLKIAVRHVLIATLGQTAEPVSATITEYAHGRVRGLEAAPPWPRW